MCLRSVRRKSATLAAFTGARRLPVARFFREWPRTPQDFAGRLEPDFFISRKPAGKIRLLEEADVSFCRDLYALLEERKQVPPGFAISFERWLQEPDSLRLAIKMNGALAGCGGLWLQQEDATPADEHTVRLAGGGLAFGLIHPRYQRHGLGRTLLAFRLLAMHRMGHPVCGAEGTECSVAYLERAGFRFWRIWQATGRAALYSGGVVLTDEDAALLESWLGSEFTAVLSLLTPPAPRPPQGSSGPH